MLFERWKDKSTGNGGDAMLRFAMLTEFERPSGSKESGAKKEI